MAKRKRSNSPESEFHDSQKDDGQEVLQVAGEGDCHTQCLSLTGKCHILAISGELRNHIYRFALETDRNHHIDSHGPGEPALLKTCRTIRHEAGQIYYGEIQFRLHIHDYGGARLLPFWKQYKRVNSSLMDITRPQNVAFAGNEWHHPSWDNLVKWIKAAHFEQLPVLVEDSVYSRADFVVAEDIDMTDLLDVRSWKEKEKACEAIYDSLRGSDNSWLKWKDRVRRVGRGRVSYVELDGGDV